MSAERERAVKLSNYANSHMRDKPTADIPDAWRYWSDVKMHLGYVLHGDPEARYGLDRLIALDAKSATDE